MARRCSLNQTACGNATLCNRREGTVNTKIDAIFSTTNALILFALLFQSYSRFGAFRNILSQLWSTLALARVRRKTRNNRKTIRPLQTTNNRNCVSTKIKVVHQVAQNEENVVWVAQATTGIIVHESPATMMMRSFKHKPLLPTWLVAFWRLLDGMCE